MKKSVPMYTYHIFLTEQNIKIVYPCQFKRWKTKWMLNILMLNNVTRVKIEQLQLRLNATLPSLNVLPPVICTSIYESYVLQKISKYEIWRSNLAKLLTLIQCARQAAATTMPGPYFRMIVGASFHILLKLFENKIFTPIDLLLNYVDVWF